MSATLESTGPLHRPSWIVSAWWDLSYIVVTPILIVPVVLILAQRWLTAEEISLAVIAFASLGHHLPGFMRAYGDRELFLRYRLRFLLVPVLVFGIALLFSPPGSIASALELPWTHLHGLELILLIWGTWHGLMQTYGFMRIYDVRLGVNDRWTARLDHWLCLMVFVAGVVFSDARVFGIAEAMWQSGLPLFGPEWLDRARWIVGTTGVCVLIAYLINQFRLHRQGIPVSWIKLLLIGTTGWFYWYTGRLSTNVLIGIAMFEIYHAVQYYAIVWIYNRRLFQRAGDRFGPLGFLFRDRWSMLGIYLAAIAAYSSIRWFNVDANAYVFRGGSQEAHQWLVAMFVTSSFLHFYFDGFIWKVSEKSTQQNLVDEIAHTSIAERYVPALLHGAKWAILLATVGGLLYTERFTYIRHGEREGARLRALMALTPELPECKSLLSRHALARGDAKTAVELAQQALALRPRSHAAHADLALAYMMLGQLNESKRRFETAIELAPKQWAHHCDYGILLARQGDARAEQELLEAVRLEPGLEQPRQYLAEYYLQEGREQEALHEIREIAKLFPKSLTGEIGQVLLSIQRGNHQEAVELASFLSIGNPENWRVQLVYGLALNASGEPEAALGALEIARGQRSKSALVHHQIGFAHFALNEPAKAIAPLKKAIQLQPDYSDAYLKLGNAYFLLHRWELAREAYQQSWDLQPGELELGIVLGGLQLQLGDAEDAEKTYRVALALHPDSKLLNYNLGGLLWQQGNTTEAKLLLLRAQELGMQLPADIRALITGK